MDAVIPVKAANGLRCRQIAASDLDAVVALFRKGFADRSEAYWRRGLARHAARALPDGYPEYGYLLEADGTAVGVLLTLHTTRVIEGRPVVCCNVSTWYVEPAFRSQGSLLEKVATRRPDVIYLDVTPSPDTHAILAARGFTRYCAGQMLAVPLLSRGRRGASVRRVTPDDPIADLDAGDRTLVRDHLGYGCIALVGTDAAGSVPLVLQRRTIGLIQNNKRLGQVPCAQVVHCRAPGDLARFSSAVGRHLLRRPRGSGRR